MQFRTILEPHKAAFDLNYHTPILTVGSCFAENIGNRLSDLRFPININPFGILFNPISVADCLNYLMTETIFTENDIFENNGLWHSWLHHGRFSSPEKNITIFLTSSMVGRKSVAAIACGAFESMPEKVGSNLPISKELPR